MDKLLVVTKAGTIRTLYSDDLTKKFPNAKQKITRASSVEPDPDGPGWRVTLSDAVENGQYAGHVIARNVPLRAEALRLEVEFIQNNILRKA